jgi:O-antigen/teichoic acid export membrane protein
VVSAVWLVVAARLLPLDAFSDLALVVALGSALFFLSDAGYSTLLSAHVAAAGFIQPAAVRDAIRRRLWGSLLAGMVLAAGYAAAANDHSLVIPLLFTGSLAGNAVHGTIVAAYRSIGHGRIEAVNEVASRVLVLALGGAWLAWGGGVRAAVIAYACGDLLSAAVLSLHLGRWTRRHPAPDAPLPDLRLRKVVPLAVGAGLSTIYGRLDTWLVALLAPGGAAGIYAACVRLVESVRLPSTVVGAVTLADASRVDPEGGTQIARRRAMGMVVLSCVPAVLLIAFAAPILRHTFGAPFVVGAGPLRILGLSIVASAVVSVLGPLAAVRSGIRYAAAVGAVVGVNAGVNVLLIPVLGMSGASWAQLTSESLLALGFWASVRRSGQSRANT